MIKTSRQLKDKIRNLSKDMKTEPHILMRKYMMERFLERLSLSAYKDKFILKGGMLIASTVGIESRSTMDIDATVKGMDLSLESAESAIKAIIDTSFDDGVEMVIKSVAPIMDEADYNGVRISLDAYFDGTKNPLKIDISTGDIIIPHEVQHKYKLMFEDRDIRILSYTLETVLAEKLETVIARSVLNTRMRDFYDIYILLQTKSENISTEYLAEALRRTSNKRNSAQMVAVGGEILNDVRDSTVMQGLWKSYQANYPYAENVTWNDVMNATKRLYALAYTEEQVLPLAPGIHQDEQENKI